jgi:PTS system nitrogen regulatory IIA component
MEIKDFLAPAQAIIDVRASDKAALLHELARRAAAALDMSADVIVSALLKREELGSTGTGSGVAVPHARLAGIDKPFGLLARLVKLIDFESIDSRPVDIVFLLLLPEKAQGAQLNALACAARALRDPEAVRDIRRATDSDAMYRAAAGAADKPH